MFLHFYTIKYLPTFDLTSLMGTIAAVAVLGVLLFVMLFVLLVLPGLALIAGDLLGVVQPLPSIKQGQRFNEAESAQALSLLRAWAVGSAIGLIALASCILADAPLGVFYGLFSWAPGVWAALVVVALWKNICPLAKKPWGMAIFSYLTFTYFAGVSFVCVRRRHLESRVDPTSLLDVGLKKIPLKARCAVSRCCFSPAVAAAACRCRGPAWWAAWPACRSARRADRCRWPWRWPAGS